VTKPCGYAYPGVYVSGEQVFCAQQQPCPDHNPASLHPLDPGEEYDPRHEDPLPDYGGAWDGFQVTSDADPGL
jgi:hypothetical protein